ncbi:sulfotransferase family 2 domain-containing protein [Novosphingobium mangrovi (ex Hu et al. 2023)]|uniref:Sulfotransferase family protein n=1 Tax=Novosphingobium mangrovi (ex Hu et al. 2023) TaxID=2930094 RepID=A0ABT0ACD7_9SPHN|nr:sulfotransferase family 2 domain-containing protein [Novosphingobium mangrovi (ex Hu et al. 2023)]MCJ1960824.1 sulfotransferase family protein [Novosphingobium mangrovi (ex Hu et al. 2023)]
MIVNYSRKYIFLHSRKTAGSSISVELARSFGPEDIMVGGWGDALNAGVRLNAACEGYARAQMSLAEKVYRTIKRPSPGRINQLVKEYFKREHHFEEDAHSSAEAIRSFAGPFWDEAYKFTFVRNPWDYAVSDYYWRKCHRKDVSFKDFLCIIADPSREDPEGVRPPIVSNWSIYTIDDVLAADFVGRYENLHEDIDTISKRLGVPINLKKTNAKGNVRVSKDIKSLYDDDTIEMVRMIYRNEIESFKYEVPF